MITAHIVIGRRTDGNTSGIYCGPDSTKALAAFQEAGPEFEEVHIYHHPMPANARYPQQEKIDADTRMNQAQQDKANAVEALRAKSAENRKKVKELEAEAKKLQSQANQLEETLKQN